MNLIATAITALTPALVILLGIALVALAVGVGASVVLSARLRDGSRRGRRNGEE